VVVLLLPAANHSRCPSFRTYVLVPFDVCFASLSAQALSSQGSCLQRHWASAVGYSRVRSYSPPAERALGGRKGLAPAQWRAAADAVRGLSAVHRLQPFGLCVQIGKPKVEVLSTHPAVFVRPPRGAGGLLLEGRPVPVPLQRVYREG